MRTKLLWLPCLLLVCLLWATSSLAVPATPYDPGLMLRYQSLSGTQQALFDLLYDAALRLEQHVSLPDGTRYQDAAAAMNALLDDCPELCALESRYSITYYDTAPDIATAITLSYSLTADQQQQTIDFARAVAGQAQGTAYDRELLLHDLICRNVTYQLTGPAVHSAYGALMDGQASCEGYADALLLLGRLAGIPSMLVTGDAETDGRWERHAWCLMVIGGSPVLVDPTWNDQDASGLCTYWYFNLTDAQMARDHRADANLPLPACTDEDLSWHARNDCLAEGSDSEAVITQAIDQLLTDGTPLNLRFAGEAEANAFLASLESRLTEAMQRMQTAAAITYTVYAQALQGCVIVTLNP